MPHYQNHSPRDSTLRVRMSQAALEGLHEEADRMGLPLSEYVRGRLAKGVAHTRWRAEPPWNGAYWIAVPGAVGPTLAIVSHHTGRDYRVELPFWDVARRATRRDGLPALEGAIWMGPLEPPNVLVPAQAAASPLTRPLVDARGAVRCAVVERHGETEEAIMRRVDRCVEALIHRAARSDFLDLAPMPSGPQGPAWVLEAVCSAIQLPERARTEAWREAVAVDLWGLVAHARWDQLADAEEALLDSLRARGRAQG